MQLPAELLIFMETMGIRETSRLTAQNKTPTGAKNSCLLSKPIAAPEDI